MDSLGPWAAADGQQWRELDGRKGRCSSTPGDPHAWKALEDSECLVFTRGPRSGENYEEDTYRLDTPLLS